MIFLQGKSEGNYVLTNISSFIIFFLMIKFTNKSSEEHMNKIQYYILEISQ